MREFLQHSPVRQIGLPGALIFLALIVRVAYVLLAPQIDPILRRDPLYGDASGYQLLALNLLKGFGLTWDGITPTSYRMPGYPAFLALIYSLVGVNLQAVRLVQALLGALTCIPVYAIAKRLGGTRVAALSGLGVALHPILIYVTGWIYSETLFLFVLYAAIWAFGRLISNRGWAFVIPASILLGLSTLVRSEIAWFPVLLAGVFMVYQQIRGLFVKAIVVQAVLLLTVTPWTARNYLVHGNVVLFATATGSTLYGANNPRADGGMAKDQVFILPNMSEVESDRALTQRAVEWMTAQPGDFLLILPLKFLRFFSPSDMKTDSGPLGRWTMALDGVYAIFLSVAGIGAWSMRKQSQVIMLLALTAWYLLLALVFSGGTRVALPIAPALVILAALGIQSVIYTGKPDEFLAR